ncbi:MAG TPA: oligopeptide/dipeptide ABC transporter ATP-binding protein [Polyangiaceae bacterium]|nr:oligopeptide/dipeptide ABC transporter ATP-binding protein [Polyangiaceae bacterium]
MTKPLLRVADLAVSFASPEGPIRAVDGVDFELQPGETLALVGESGSGKSTLARAVIGLTATSRGSIELEGEQVVGADRAKLRELRRKMQLVFQDPYESLNPRMTIGRTIAEPLLYQANSNAAQRAGEVERLLARVGLDPGFAARYPHEFSGGQRQRISLARALAMRPRLLLCDEVTSALDVSVQAQILELLRTLQRELGLAYLFITHDLGVVRSIAQRVAVMYLGKLVELRTTESFFEQPRHPYSQALLGSVPRLRRAGDAASSGLTGEIPSAARPPSGCRFHTRCPKVFDRCPREEPGLYPIPNGVSRCFLDENEAGGEINV